MAKNDSVNVYMYDEIGGSLFSEGVTFKSVQQKISENPSASNINVFIDSPGGDVLQGYSIYNLLNDQKKQGKTVNVKIHGLCASIATLIASAATSKPKAPKNSRWLIHNPFASVQGDAETLATKAGELKQMENDLVGAYIGMTGKAEEELRALMKEDRLMTAEEAASWGFVELEEDLKAKAYFNFDKKENSIEKMTNTILEKLKELGDLFKSGSNAKAMTTKLADGTEVFVETEGEPKTGDKVYIGTDNTGTPAPDGKHTLENGTMITVSGGAITEIEAPVDTEGEDTKKLKEEVLSLQAQLAEANAKAEAFKAQAESATASLSEKETIIASFDTKYKALVKMAQDGAPLGEFKKVFNTTANANATAAKKDDPALGVFDTIKQQLINYR